MEEQAPAVQNPRRVNPTTLVVHGHFYQPPRENPWTEAVSREASAGPFHDWNERIAAECYRPNAFARIVDGDGRLLDVVNNYSLLSFNIGPTLMSWLEHHQPVVYERILAAQWSARGAIAQAWNHMILPLASERDARTQIRWGLADFRHRFGTEPAGLWLPETAVNERTLALLAEEGISFTILAPSQAGATRPLAGAVSPGPSAIPNREWQAAVAGGLDTRVPYRWLHPERPGAGVDIVFYNGQLSHDLAFSSMPSETLVDRVAAAGGRRGGLITVALDGETFGHHQKWMDRGVAYALSREGPRRGIRVANLAAWLRSNRPTSEVAVRESAWSCAHGVGRWRTDCGCSTGGAPGTNQRWRAPLRAALDRLRDFGAEVFERRGADVFAGDPWDVRDAYVDVLLGATTPDEFAAHWVSGDRVEAFTLLEAQRQAMLMYTSCGWFFHDLAGLETVQVLRYAARTMDLLDELGEATPRDAVAEILAGARSHHDGDGEAVWAAHVIPARVDAHRVAAHLVLADLFGSGDPRPVLGNMVVGEGEAGTVVSDDAADGNPAFCWRKVHLTHRRTGRTWNLLATALRFGPDDAVGVVRAGGECAAGVEVVRRAIDAGADRADLLALLHSPSAFTGAAVAEFDLGALLPEAAEALLERTTAGLDAALADGADSILGALELTARAQPAAVDDPGPVPAHLLPLATAAVMARIEELVERGAEADGAALAVRAGKLGLPVEFAARSRVGTHLTRTVRNAAAAAVSDAGGTAAALEAITIARALCPEPDMDEAQELLHAAVSGGERPDLVALAEALGLSRALFTGRRRAGAA